ELIGIPKLSDRHDPHRVESLDHPATDPPYLTDRQLVEKPFTGSLGNTVPHAYSSKFGDFLRGPVRKLRQGLGFCDPNTDREPRQAQNFSLDVFGCGMDLVWGAAQSNEGFIKRIHFGAHRHTR